MQAPFGRWLPAVARTSAVIARTTAVIARTSTAVARTAVAIARVPVPQRPILIATGLTVAAAVAGGQLATATTATPEAATPDSAQSAAVVETGAAAAAPADAPPAGGTGAGSAPPAAGTGAGTARKAVPSVDELIPHGTQGQQSRIPLTGEQTNNARAIVATAKKLGLPKRAAVIGVATSLQESKLENLGHLGAANDHDSLGLFQQRPSAGWGNPHQVTDPEYASTAFYNGLRNVPDWQRLPLTQAAQAVQVSAYPFAYAQWERQAAEIVQDVWAD